MTDEEDSLRDRLIVAVAGSALAFVASVGVVVWQVRSSEQNIETQIDAATDDAVRTDRLEVYGEVAALSGEYQRRLSDGYSGMLLAVEEGLSTERVASLNADTAAIEEINRSFNFAYAKARLLASEPTLECIRAHANLLGLIETRLVISVGSLAGAAIEDEPIGPTDYLPWFDDLNESRHEMEDALSADLDGSNGDVACDERTYQDTHEAILGPAPTDG